MQGRALPCEVHQETPGITFAEMGPGAWLDPAMTAELISPIMPRLQPRPPPPVSAQNSSGISGQRHSKCHQGVADGGMCPGVSSAQQSRSSLKWCDLLQQHEPLGEFELESQGGPRRKGTGSGRVEMESGAGRVPGAVSGDSPLKWGSEPLPGPENLWTHALPTWTEPRGDLLCSTHPGGRSV